MPRTCTICKHPQRAQIDAAIVGRKDLQDVAKEFDVSKFALGRHNKCGHVIELLVRNLGTRESGRESKDEISALEEFTRELLAKSSRANDRKMMAEAIKMLQGFIELRAELKGQKVRGARNKTGRGGEGYGTAESISGEEGQLEELIGRAHLFPAERRGGNGTI